MKNGKRITVAVDGPAGSGKSSVCRKTALELGLQYIDSGAIYRAITWFFMNNYPDFRNVEEPAEKLADVLIEQEFCTDGKAKTYVNGSDVSLLIREESVAKNISNFSDNNSIREFVNSLLRGWSGENSVIMDGRDIGTVVFPHADIKIYLDASVDVRTTRRVKEYADLGKKVDENSIRNQIIQRDFNDQNREFAPLKKADDALYIDTSEMTFDEVVDKLKGLINRI
ncbi:MAG TPA: (d)CMP kinase [Spirochaetota bacterium]|nr:(d)CMP kinase [Spirochaetota bacterium]HPJ33778.1 (d)CMP kinase [Spirochaetota bacterium]